jgi:hypothetical protein
MIGIGIAKKVGAIDGTGRTVPVRGIDPKMKISRHTFLSLAAWTSALPQALTDTPWHRPGSFRPRRNFIQPKRGFLKRVPAMSG